MEAILTAISEQCFDQGFRLHRKEDCVQNLLYYFQCLVLRQTSSGFEVSDVNAGWASQDTAAKHKTPSVLGDCQAK